MTENKTGWRFTVSIVVLMLALTGLGVRLAFLHLGPEEKTLVKLEKKRSMAKKIHPGRGIICDCNGEDNILAINLFVKDVCADPSIVATNKMMAKVASLLSEKLDLPLDEVSARLRQKDAKGSYKKGVYVKRLVRQEVVSELEAQRLAGVFFQDTTARHYPHGSFMCHLLGFVNYEGIGSAGIEQEMDKYLRGSPGSVEAHVDANQRELPDEYSLNIPPLDGANVVLTIDQNLQYMVEKALDGVMVEHHAKGAWAIVERVKTGEILAMASRPAYDLNEFSSADDNVKLNRAIGMIYEPGSTFKPIVIAGALNEGIITSGRVFDCENGSWMHCNRILRDSHPNGHLTVADGLKKSSNILTAKVALMLGEKRMYQYMRKFGVGSKTGLDMPGEESGILHSLSKWSGISASRISIGQGVSVTALQMVNMICAIANDGYLMRPYVVSQVQRSNGTVLVSTKPEILSRPISAETAAVMKKLLARVTEEGGTGTRARVEGYEVAGKTGTAQKPVNGSYSSTAYTSSFLGFLPVEDPEIALIVVVDEPQPVHYGSVVAAPVFSKIANQAARYLDIQPGKDSGGVERRHAIAANQRPIPIRVIDESIAGDANRGNLQ